MILEIFAIGIHIHLNAFYSMQGFPSFWLLRVQFRPKTNDEFICNISCYKVYLKLGDIYTFLILTSCKSIYIRLQPNLSFPYLLKHVFTFTGVVMVLSIVSKTLWNNHGPLPVNIFLRFHSIAFLNSLQLLLSLK